MKFQSFYKIFAIVALSAGLGAMIQAEEYRGLLGSGGILGTGIGKQTDKSYPGLLGGGGVLGTGIGRSNNNANNNESSDNKNERSRRNNRRDRRDQRNNR